MLLAGFTTAAILEMLLSVEIPFNVTQQFSYRLSVTLRDIFIEKKERREKIPCLSTRQTLLTVYYRCTVETVKLERIHMNKYLEYISPPCAVPTSRRTFSRVVSSDDFASPSELIGRF